MKLYMKVGLLVALVLVLVSSVTIPVHAAVFDRDGVIGKDEVINDDVFLSANDVVVDGTVNGILFAAGNSVTINGVVNGDLFAVGRTVIISSTGKVDGNVFMTDQVGNFYGQVSGSVFGGGAALILGEKAQVGRNLFFGGYSFESKPETVITRSLYTGTYQTIVGGEVKQDLYATSAAVELSSKIGGNANINLGERQPGRATTQSMMPFMNQPGMPAAVQPGLRVADSASVGGKLSYTSSIDETNNIKGVQAGQVIYKTPVPSTKNTKSSSILVNTQPPLLNWFFNFLRELIALLVFGGLALWLIPAAFQRSVDQAKEKALLSAGYGTVVVLVGYAGAALLLAIIFSVGILLAVITLGSLSGPVFGLGLSSLGLAFAIFTFLVDTGSKVIVSILIGQIFMGRVAPNSGNQKFWTVLSGTLIYALVHSIPFLGWIIGLAATLIGIGAMWLAYQAYRKSRSTMQVVTNAG